MITNLSPIGSAIKRLTVWEQQFKPWFRTITLLGEIPLSTSQVEEICQDLRTAGSVRVRRSDWPHTVVVCMAAIAAHNDERRYWGVLAESLGLPNSQQTHNDLGSLFQEYLRKYKLPTFQSVGGYRHVTPIRLHGGIPAYSLPDFFREVILIAMRHPDYVGLDAHALIPLILQRTVVQLFVDSPVRYFLEHGGEAAKSFLDRCLAMARRWETEDSVLSAQDLELPRYVVDAFASYMEGQAQTPQGKRLRPPRLFLTPSASDTLYNLEFPDEPVDAEHSDWHYAWRIQAIPVGGCRLFADDVQHERVKVRRSGHDLIAVGRTVPLFFPPCQLRIQFEGTPPAGEIQILGQWRLSLAPVGDQPILGFRSGDGSPLRNCQFLPADTLTLLYPTHARLEVAGEAHCVQRFPALLGDWAGWQIEEWNLQEARALWLVDKSGVQMGQPLSVHQVEDEARLQGGNRLAGVRDSENIPLFVGAPPDLWLPRLTADRADKEWELWRITITPRWATYSKVRGSVERSLSHWAADIRVDKTGFTLPLAGLLGEDALGSFSLEIRGPRSFHQELRLRLWSEVTIEDLAPYYIPGERGADAVCFRIRVPVSHQVKTPVGETDTEVQPTGEIGGFQITVAPTANEAVLELVAPSIENDPIRLGMRLAVPRLRWLLHLDDRQTEWRTTSDTVPAARLLQNQRRELILDWSGVANPPACAFLLCDDTVDPPQVLQEQRFLHRQSSHQRIHQDLTVFYDTLQHYADVPIITLALRLDSPVHEHVIPLLFLKRSLDIQAVTLEWDRQGRTWLRWDAKHRLRNRRVRIWSAWRPWEAARELVIPDDVPADPDADGPGSGMICLPEHLPVGWYQISLRTAHSWEPLEAPPLPTGDALLCQEGDWVLRAVELMESVERSAPSSFFAHWELACIFDSVDDHPARAEHIDWLSRHLEHANPCQLVVLRRWMISCDPRNAKALRFRMYRLENLRRLFAEEKDEGTRIAYLDDFRQATAIAAESAQLVLDHIQKPDLINYALNVLMKEDVGSVVAYLLNEMAKGAYSDQDALTLLQKRATESFFVLKKHPLSAARNRLLERLSAHVEKSGIIRPGDWLHCEAGWGRLTRILRGEKEEAFCFDDDAVLLHVLLRDGHEGEPVEIDTERKTIRFLQAMQVYHCRKMGCTGFRSYSERLLREKHSRAAHLGIGPAYEIKPACSSYSRPLISSQRPPTDIFR